MPRDGRGGPPGGMTAYRTAAFVFAIVFAGIGIALLIETALVGGSTGYLLGALFLLAGVGRLYVLVRSSGR